MNYTDCLLHCLSHYFSFIAKNKHSFLFNNKKYKAGTTSNDIKVETINPDIIVHANGGHNVLLVITNGNKPATVVMVVNNMGLARLFTA